MSKPASKKYVVVMRSETESGDKKNFRSVPMSESAAMAEVADFERDGIKAQIEEANDEDLKQTVAAKLRLKERKERKKLNDAHRLFSEEWFTKYE